MSKPPPEVTVDNHFVGEDSAIRETYDHLLTELRKLGPVHEEPKKTSIHLSRSSALVGVRVRRDYLLLTIKADREWSSSRVLKTERVSANRYHHEIRLAKPAELDAELRERLASAYELSR
jgi:Domain of unknown function (DUF5655)